MPNYDPKDPSFFTQQVMLIGTYDENEKERFAPISWCSYTWGPPPCLVVSIWGTKQTKKNIARTGLFSAAVLTPNLLPLSEQFNRGTYQKQLFDALDYTVQKGSALDVPVLQDSVYSFECEVLKTMEIGETITYFGEIKNVQMTEEIKKMEFHDLQKINPVIYADGHYFSVGAHLGKIGDFAK